MTDSGQKLPTKLLWLDLEMTGLDPYKDVILEVVVKVTDFDFYELASYQAIIHQPEEAIDSASDWCQQKFTANGLFERVRTSQKSEASVKKDLVTLIHEQFSDEKAVLAGNSIHQDRAFIRHWWPEVDQLLHYRMLDVSTLKVLMQGRYGLLFEKKETHRAMDDIDESIAELKYYLKWFATHSVTANDDQKNVASSAQRPTA